MARSYFEQQQRARGRTRLLIVLLAAATVFTIAALYLAIKMAVAAVLVIAAGKGPTGESYELVLGRELMFWYQDPTLPIVTLTTTVIVVVGSLLKTLQLRHGGASVAELLGARAIEPATHEPGERVFIDVAEELAIATGCPVPRLYVLDAESSINALVAGRTAADAALVVSKGCLSKLNPGELRAVLAHELVHCLNGEMKLNLGLMGILAGLVAVGKVGGSTLRSLRLDRGRARSAKETAGDIVLFLVAGILAAIGSFGVFAARMLKAIVSGHSELAADASAARFSRDPGGLAGALLKIRETGSAIVNAQVEDLTHMFFACATGTMLFRFLASHPTVQVRLATLAREAEGPGADAGLSEPARGVAAMMTTEAAGILATPSSSALSIGRPAFRHLLHARAVLGAIGEPLRNTLRTPDGARAVVYALFIVKDAAEQRRITGDGPALELARGLSQPLADLGASVRLPLIELCLPVLRKMPPDEIRRFLAAIEDLLATGARAGIFERALAAIVIQRLQAGARIPAESTALGGVRPECGLLFSLLVDARQATLPASPRPAAFEAAMRSLFPALPPPTLSQPEACTPGALSAALARLAGVSAHGKERLVHALCDTVLADGRVTVAEAELLRSLVAALGCPMPPLLDDTAAGV